MGGAKILKKKTNWKQKCQGGVTTFGDPIVPHIDAVNGAYEKYLKEVTAINNLLVEPVPDQPRSRNWKQKRFMVITIVPYCKDEKNELVPAEFSAVVFSFEEGLVDGITSLMDPKTIPYGQMFEVSSSCEINALPYPGKFERSKTGGIQSPSFYAGLKDLAKNYGTYMEDGNEKKILMFTTKGDFRQVNCCLGWLKRQEEENSAEPVPKIKVAQFETLIKLMSRMDGNNSETEGVIQHEGGSAKFIYHPRYDYYVLLACKWHQREENVGKICMCANSITLRRVYNALFYLCHLYGLEIKLPTHKPPA